MCKDIWNVDCGVWRVYYEQNTNCGITRFKEGRKDVNDDARLGRPNKSTTVENIKAVKKIILDNHRITIKEVAHVVGIPIGSCQAIFPKFREERVPAPGQTTKQNMKSISSAISSQQISGKNSESK